MRLCETESLRDRILETAMPECLEEGAPQMNAKEKDQQVHSYVLGLLLHMDPLNINYGGGKAVYAPDADAIVNRLPQCQSEWDVCAVIHEQLRLSFGAEAIVPFEQYLPIAKEIWEFWTASIQC